MVKFYCVSCRKPRNVERVRKVTKKGRNFMTATCPVCGITMYRIGG